MQFVESSIRIIGVLLSLSYSYLNDHSSLASECFVVQGNDEFLLRGPNFGGYGMQGRPGR